MTRNARIRRFRNTFAILMNVDKHELEVAGVMRPDQVGGGDWERFNKDIGMFVLKLPDDRLEALYELVESRQPEQYRDGS